MGYTEKRKWGSILGYYKNATLDSHLVLTYLLTYLLSYLLTYLLT